MFRTARLVSPSRTSLTRGSRNENGSTLLTESSPHGDVGARSAEWAEWANGDGRVECFRIRSSPIRQREVLLARVSSPRRATSSGRFISSGRYRGSDGGPHAGSVGDGFSSPPGEESPRRSSAASVSKSSRKFSFGRRPSQLLLREMGHGASSTRLMKHGTQCSRVDRDDRNVRAPSLSQEGLAHRPLLSAIHDEVSVAAAARIFARRTSRKRGRAPGISYVARRRKHPEILDRIGLGRVLPGGIDLFTDIERACGNALGLTRGLHAHSASGRGVQVAVAPPLSEGRATGVLANPSRHPVRPNRTHRTIQRVLVSISSFACLESWHRAPLVAEEELGMQAVEGVDALLQQMHSEEDAAARSTNPEAKPRKGRLSRCSLHA